MEKCIGSLLYHSVSLLCFHVCVWCRLRLGMSWEEFATCWTCTGIILAEDTASHCATCQNLFVVMHPMEPTSGHDVSYVIWANLGQTIKIQANSCIGRQ